MSLWRFGTFNNRANCHQTMLLACTFDLSFHIKTKGLCVFSILDEWLGLEQVEAY